MNTIFYDAFANEINKIARAKEDEIEIRERKPFYARPVSGTIGRIPGSITSSLVTTNPIHRSTTKQDVEAVTKQKGYNKKDYYSDKLGLPLSVNSGSTNTIKDLKKIWGSKKISLPGKLYGSLGTLGTVGTNLTRADHYNPYSHSVTSFNPDKAVVKHELGHAKDFAKTNHPWGRAFARGLPIVGVAPALSQEAKASRNAAKASVHDSEKEQRATNRKLTAAFGTYVGGTVGAAGGRAYSMARASGSPDKVFRSKAEKSMKRMIKDRAEEAAIRNAKPFKKALLRGKSSLRRLGRKTMTGKFLGAVGGAAVGAGVGHALQPFSQNLYKETQEASRRN